MRRFDSVSQRYDVVIVGAGAAGCAAAIALLQQMPQLTVLLLERNGAALQQFRIGETLPPQTAVLFQQLGLLESFQARGDMPALGTRSYWGGAQVNENPFLYSFYGHGWHIDRVAFDCWMMRQAEAAGATVIKGAVLTGAPEYDERWRLTVNRNDAESMTIDAPLVIDASGRGAAFCRSLGIRANKLDKLMGIFRFFQADNGAGDRVVDSFTLVESSADGWWYSADLPHGRRVAALMTDSDLVRDLKVLDEKGWHRAMARARQTCKRFVNTRPLTPLQVRPSHSQYLKRFSGTGWYAAGDAATLFDPLSSLGIFKAIRHGVLASYAVRDDLQGKPGAGQKYHHVLQSEFEHYLRTRRNYYAMEGRFAGAPFWQRRQEGRLTEITA
ncbi:MAG: tryptophan 7-halogenase [Nitrosomonas sp.]|nr:tryptophan 7-halogenase [Nitrosomonas sp.]